MITGGDDACGQPLDQSGTSCVPPIWRDVRRTILPEPWPDGVPTP